MPGAPQPYQTSWCGTDPSTAGGSGSPVTLLGVFTFGADGWVMALKYFRDLADDANHVGFVTDPDTGVMMSAVSFRHHNAETAGPGGWETAYLHPRLPVVDGQKVAVGIYFAASYFYYDAGALASTGFSCGDVLTDQNDDPFPNMQFTYAGFDGPFSGSGGSRYGIDLVFLAK